MGTGKREMWEVREVAVVIVIGILVLGPSFINGDTDPNDGQNLLCFQKLLMSLNIGDTYICVCKYIIYCFTVFG